ncbi:MAG: cytochrome c family protein [Pseudomonadota bacterium]
MESLEFNKIAAAVLTAVLIVVAVSKLGGILYHADSPDEMSYIVETDDPSGIVSDDTAPAMSFDQLLAVALPDGGERISRKCTSCHTFEAGGAAKQGPNLWNIVGAEVASVPGYDYSSALQGLGGVWSYDRLSDYLAGPRAYAPGTKMTFAGISDMAERADLIAWMRTLSDDPLPLPEVVMDVGGAESEGDATGTMEDASGDASDAGSDAMDDASDAASDAMDSASDAASDTMDAASDAADDAMDAASDAADAVGDAADDAADAVGDAADDASDAIENATDGDSN